MFDTIDDQRRFADRIVIGGTWVLAPLVGVAAAVTGGSWPMLLGAAVALAGGATAVWRLSGQGPGTRMMAGVSLMGVVSLLVAAFSGHPWQLDMHMAYFAALAVLIVYCDWRVVAAATAVVAVHHLMLSYVLPAAVFPGGGHLDRVILHAVILLAEAGVLIWASNSIHAMFQRSAAALATANAERVRAEAAVIEAESARSSEAQATAQRETERRAADHEANQVVEALADALARLASGDVTHRITAQVPAQYAQMRQDFNGAAEQLQSTLRTIVEVNIRVRASVNEIAQASTDLSRRTEGQAATLEQTAAALDEITATARRTADAATRAREAVGGARANAEGSGEIVQAAIKAMNGIEESSRQIGRIIGVIDEIAFQTNLLALNAGVEAARAGDAGRGFAVVASEVRALAQRTAEAAKEIKTLISASADQVVQGVALVGRTGEAMGQIVVEVGDVSGVIGEIAASAQNESAGLQEVNTAVNALDRVTQQNAAMVEESTAATHQLAQDTERLTELVGCFNVGAGGAASGPVRRRAA